MNHNYFQIYNTTFTKKLSAVVTILLLIAIVISISKYVDTQPQNAGYASVTDIPTPTETISAMPEE